MNYPRYPEYKPSGVEWLGEVPGHWGMNLLKRGFDVCLGKMLQTAPASKEDVEASYLRAANIQWNGVDISDVKTMWLSPAERKQLTLLPGDLLVSEGGDVGRSSVWKGELAECYFQNSVNRVRAHGDNSTRFLFYWLSAIKEGGYIDVVCNKSTIAHFTAEKVAAAPVPFPTPAEQRAIATFLDRETARIDALIEKKRRFIELLQEKRAALISRAVTRGLDPNVPLKDSGVEWLGQVSVSWKVLKLKHLLVMSLTNGLFKKRDEFGKGVRLVNVFDIYSPTYHVNFEKLERVTATKSEGQSFDVQEGDLFFVRSSLKLEGIGASALAKNLGEPAVFECHLVRARPNRSRIFPRFLSYYLNARRIRGRIISLAETTTMTTIAQDRLSSLEICVPELNEQKAIADHLDQVALRLETLSAKVESAIERLKEYRAALIAAAVTGKVDVRAA